MTKLKIMIMGLVASFGILMAGGNVSPLVPSISVVQPYGLYVGIAATASQAYVDGESDWFTDTENTETGYGLQAQIGYEFMRTGSFALAVEARVNKTFGKFGQNDWSIDDDPQLLSYSALMKPSYFVTQDISVYGLVGYGVSDYTNGGYETDNDDFVIGAGVGYDVSERITIVADYVVNPTFINEDGTELENNTFSIGANYKF